MKQLQIIPYIAKEKPKKMGYVQEFRYKNNYRKSDSKENRCINCQFFCHHPRWNKCKALKEISSSPNTDIRQSYICNLFKQKE